MHHRHDADPDALHLQHRQARVGPAEQHQHGEEVGVPEDVAGLKQTLVGSCQLKSKKRKKQVKKKKRFFKVRGGKNKKKTKETFWGRRMPTKKQKQNNSNTNNGNKKTTTDSWRFVGRAFAALADLSLGH